MNKPDLSILLPSIRPQNLDAFYNSILSSTKRDFELIVVSPYALPLSLQDKKNVKFIRDFGSPTRCTNLGFLVSEGKLVTDCTDDAIYLPNALDESIDLFYQMSPDPKNVVIHMYYESQNRTNEALQGDNYYKINGSRCSQSPYIPNNWYIFNSFIMNREFFEEMGGLDCEYQATAMAHIDQAVRCQKEGAIVKVYNKAITSCDHNQPDHGAIEIAQIGFDEPLYQKKYRNPAWIMNEMKLDINNWKNADAIWDKRVYR